MYQIAFLLLATVGGTLSQIVVNGTCPISSGTTGSIANIQGTWYQIERIPNPEEIGECATTSFNANVTAISKVEVVNQRRNVRNGAITRHNNVPYRFTVTFSDNLPRDYYLVGTNFVNYAVIARCQQITTNNVTSTNLYAWKLGRNNSLTVADSVAINQHLSAIPALANATWRAINHTAAGCYVNSGAGSLAPSLVAIVVAGLFAAKVNY